MLGEYCIQQKNNDCSGPLFGVTIVFHPRGVVVNWCRLHTSSARVRPLTLSFIYSVCGCVHGARMCATSKLSVVSNASSGFNWAPFGSVVLLAYIYISLKPKDCYGGSVFKHMSLFATQTPEICLCHKKRHTFKHKNTITVLRFRWYVG